MSALVTASRRRSPPPEIREAWLQYVEELRHAEPGRYPEVEPWAWARLQTRLRIAKRRKVAR